MRIGEPGLVEKRIAFKCVLMLAQIFPACNMKGDNLQDIRFGSVYHIVRSSQKSAVLQDII